MNKDQINKSLNYVSALFDIVGKTVDNVEWAPGVFDADHIIIYFTDGSALKITASEEIESVVWVKHGS